MKIKTPIKSLLNILQAIGLFLAAYFFISSFKRNNSKAELHDKLSETDHQLDLHQDAALKAKQKARSAEMKAQLRIDRLYKDGNNSMADLLKQLNKGAKEL